MSLGEKVLEKQRSEEIDEVFLSQLRSILHFSNQTHEIPSDMTSLSEDHYGQNMCMETISKLKLQNRYTYIRTLNGGP